MVEAAFWGLVGASSMIVAAEIAFVIPSRALQPQPGALLTMMADQMAPGAHDRSAVYAGPAAFAGFCPAVFSTSLDSQ